LAAIDGIKVTHAGFLIDGAVEIMKLDNFDLAKNSILRSVSVGAKSPVPRSGK